MATSRTRLARMIENSDRAFATRAGGEQRGALALATWDFRMLLELVEMLRKDPMLRRAIDDALEKLPELPA